MLKDVFPVIQQIIKEILNTEGIGKAKRHKLDLHGFGQWNSIDELHEEILQDVEKHGVTKTAKQLDIKVGTIKQIRKRKNKLKGVQ
jgi:Fic family protein